MIRLIARLFGLVGITLIFVWLVPLKMLTGSFQPAVVALSIMVAAVLVRLNRGMPTLDWKSLEVVERGKLTQAIVNVTRDYLWIMAFLAFSAVFIIAMMTVGKPVLLRLPEWAQRALSASTGALLFECIRRMSYVAWRDYDIVKLQKHLIDASGQHDHDEEQSSLSSAKIAAMKSTSLRAPPSKPPTTWN